MRHSPHHPNGRRRAPVAGLAAAVFMALAAGPLSAAAQSAPRFEAYPAPRAQAAPAKPVDFASHKVGRALRPEVRDVVRAEAAKGANFAGRYRLVTVGCGTACQAVLVIDLGTGRLFAAPASASAGVAFRRMSRLVRFNADRMHGTPARYYAFDNGRFRPIR